MSSSQLTNSHIFQRGEPVIEPQIGASWLDWVHNPNYDPDDEGLEPQWPSKSSISMRGAVKAEAKIYALVYYGRRFGSFVGRGRHQQSGTTLVDGQR